MEEIWKEVNINTNYEVSNIGNVRNKKTQRILKSWNANGYRYTWLGSKIKTGIHRLVAFAFLDNPENYNEIDHIDRDRSNNKVENLRFISHHKNMLNRGEYKYIYERKDGYYAVQYTIAIYNVSNKTFKTLEEAELYLEELKIKYPHK